jgi:hypothetical protein
MNKVTSLFIYLSLLKGSGYYDSIIDKGERILIRLFRRPYNI